MLREGAQPPLDPDLVDEIARRLTERVLARLDAVAADNDVHDASGHLTVGQVALRLGVARSTVYAHWREWGGFKLGSGLKAPIRFNAASLPGSTAPRKTSAQTQREKPTLPSTNRRRKRRSDLLTDAPRFGDPIGFAS
jgi:transposase-like protein